MAERLSASLFGTPGTKALSWRAYALLLVLCLGLYLPGLSSLPPTDRDESWFAQASKQMIESGDYIDIKFLGIPRYKKPVGIYWLQALSVKALSPHHLDQIWAYRVPSVIGATLAVLLTAALGALLFDARIGFMGAVMLASCIDLIVEAHIAKVDAALLAAVMGVQYTLARSYIIEDKSWRNAFAFWSAFACGVLLKGPIILLTLMSTLIWLRRTEKSIAWFSYLKPVAGIIYLLAIVLPWFIAINMLSHGSFAQQSAGHDFLAKLWQGQDRGFLPPGFHTAIFPGMFFPFSLFALLTAPDAWRARHEKAVRFCIGWIVPTWIVFELSSTKLPHYVLPVYPAIALLTAKYFSEGLPAASNAVRRWLPALAVIIWVMIGCALAIGTVVAPYVLDHQIDKPQMVVSLVFLIALSAGLDFYLQRKHIACVITFALGIMVFTNCLLTTTLPGLQKLWMAKLIVEMAHKVQPCRELKIVSAGFQEPSLAFLAGAPTKLVPNGNYAAGEMQHDLCRVGVISKPLLKEFLHSTFDTDTEPVFTGEMVEGFNSGHGGTMQLFFYIMPQSRKADPLYP